MEVTYQGERISILNGEIDVEKVLKDIISSENREEAFFICDIGDVVRKHFEWKKLLPRIVPYYAVKCNDNPIILEVLAALGTGFDCASKVEMEKILALGVDPSRIIYANPVKPASHICYAAVVGVDLMTFDHESELYKIKKLFPTSRLVIRIKCEAAVAWAPMGRKFGCDPMKDAPRLLRLAKKLGLDVVGVSFHVGSGCGDPPVFRRAIAACQAVFELASKLGYTFNILDVGGGYPGEKGADMSEFSEVINAAVDEYFPSLDISLIAEPGRYYVGSAFTLATNILCKKIELSSEDNHTISNVMYHINEGIYGTLNPVPTFKDLSFIKPLVASSKKLIPSTLWGPTCSGMDRVTENLLLPDMEVGDWIIFHDMGAYSLSVANQFNGMPIPEVHFIADKRTWLLLKDEPHQELEDTRTAERFCQDVSQPKEWTIAKNLLGGPISSVTNLFNC